jgi:hypothetical protein
MSYYSFRIALDWGFSDNRKFVGKYNKIPSRIYDAYKKEIYLILLASRMTFEKKKVYVSFTVFKKTMSGDCTNFVKGVCDGIKLYTKRFGLDDNWFACCADWQIDKENPRIEITVRQ